MSSMGHLGSVKNFHLVTTILGFPGGSEVKNLPAMQELWERQVRSLGWEDPLNKKMATHSSILAWRTPWIEEIGGLQSMGSQRVGHDLRDLACMYGNHSGEGNGNPLQYFAWKIPWTEEPGRLQSMGSLRVGHDWATSLSLFTFMQWRRKWQPTPVFLPGESQGRGSLVGCHLWGRTESDTTEVT